MQKDSSAVTIHDTAAVADAIARETKRAHKLVRLAVLLCIVYCVLCIVYCVLCTVYFVLCIVYCVLCIILCMLLRKSFDSIGS